MKMIPRSKIEEARAEENDNNYMSPSLLREMGETLIELSSHPVGTIASFTGFAKDGSRMLQRFIVWEGMAPTEDKVWPDGIEAVDLNIDETA